MSDPLPDIDVAVLGDLHGAFDLALDAPLLAGHPLVLCTGDLVPNGGADRFDVGLSTARDLRELGVYTVLGNHDGPSCFTGRTFPKSYRQLEAALGDLHVAEKRVEFPALGLTLVGARPLTSGSSDLRFRHPDRLDRTLEEWGAALAELLLAAEQPRILVLAHDGPTGLGARRSDIYGCDFREEEGDWGDPDLRLALDAAKAAGREVVAVIAGHMHHALAGGGERTRAVREGGTLHLNAAIVPRVQRRGRAQTIVSLRGRGASARLDWHGPTGEVVSEHLA